MFTREIYLQRRAALMQTVKTGLIILWGNDESPMNYEHNTYRFRQESSFLYFFGLQRAGLCATLDAETGEVVIYGQEYTIDDLVWMGSVPSIKHMALQVGVENVSPLSSLKTIVNKSDKIHILPPFRPEHTLRLVEILGLNPQQVHGFASEELLYAITNQRNYKSSEELVEINAAVDVSVKMHKLAMRMAKPNVKERDIFSALEHLALKNGASTAFPTIATINGQTLHNHSYGNVLKSDDLFLVDGGAETWSGYAGDLSSTVPVSGAFLPQQRDIYELVLASHKKAVTMLAPGVSFKDIYYASARVIVEGMKDLGLMRGNTDSALENGAHAMFFPCGLGHMMGLDVHDMENFGETIVGYNGVKKSTQFGAKSLRLARPLEPNFVLTIEPGIYFIPELMDLWRTEGTNSEFLCFDKLETYRHFGGIRNEEDYLITESGCQRLGTEKKPMEVDEVLSEWAMPASDLLSV